MVPYRVLHVITGMGSGGAESYIMNMYRSIDRNKIQFDFLLRSKEIIYEDEIKKLGGRIYYTSEYPKHALRNKREVKQFFKEHPEYKVIHVHGNALIYMTVLKIAKKNKIPCRIMHSHNTQTKLPAYRILHNLNKLFVKSWATDYFACSNDAGKWMFNSGYVLRRNAIDVEKFSNCDASVDSIKKSLNIENKIVIGNIARFLPSKNHNHLFKVFKEFSKSHADSVLVLVGDGDYRENVENLIKKYQIEDKVLLLGIRNDVATLLHMFDVFLFPSLFEGLPVTLIEAQASGTACVISKNITDEIRITPNVISLSLDEDISVWVRELERAISMKKIDKEAIVEMVVNSGYEKSIEAKKLEQFYVNKYENEN